MTNEESTTGEVANEIVSENPVSTPVSSWAVVSENEPSVYGGPKTITIPAVEETVVTPPSSSEEVVTPPATTEDLVSTDAPVIPVETPIVQAEIDEEKVLSFLKDKGFSAEKLEDLKPKESPKLDPEVEKYLEYKKETGRSYNDFLELQKDWTAVDKGEILMINLQKENPTLTQKQLEFLFQRDYGFDPDLDDDSEITMKEINIERDYQKGLRTLESQKEQYKVVRGSDEGIPEDYKVAKTHYDNMLKQQEEARTTYESTVQDFKAKTDNVFTNDFEGFDVKVGDASFKIKPEDVQQAKATLSDLNNFNTKFFDKEGKLADPSGYYKALHFAMNPDKVAEHFINLGKSLRAEEEERESKNIKVTGPSNVQGGLGTGKTWKVVS